VSGDLYDLLEVKRDASSRQIRSAYRRLARTYHPDHNAAPDAAARFKAVAEAYAVLSDSARRSAYDLWGHRVALGSASAIVSDEEESAFE
jgi:DnaJ-class molecular chaperone